MTLGWSFIQAKHSGFDSSQCLGLTACLRSSLQPLSIVWLTKPYTTMCECVCVLFWFCWATINTYTTVGMIGQGYLQPQSINFWPTFNSLASLCTHAVLLSRLCDSSSLSRPDNSAISFLESRNELPLLSGIYIWSTPKINVIYFTITTNLTAILTCNTKVRTRFVEKIPLIVRCKLSSITEDYPYHNYVNRSWRTNVGCVSILGNIFYLLFP